MSAAPELYWRFSNFKILIKIFFKAYLCFTITHMKLFKLSGFKFFVNSINPMFFQLFQDFRVKELFSTFEFLGTIYISLYKLKVEK